MITLITGKQNCGKSAFAEKLAADGASGRLYYIATMKVEDEDARQRRERHRKSRAGYGFETLEIPCYINEAPDLMIDPLRCAVLLECVANLVANIMHEDEWAGRLTSADSESADEFVRSILEIIRDLAEQVGELFVVTSEYDKTTSDPETKLYIELLDMVNARLRRISDKVYTEEDLGKDMI